MTLPQQHELSEREKQWLKLLATCAAHALMYAMIRENLDAGKMITPDGRVVDYE